MRKVRLMNSRGEYFDITNTVTFYHSLGGYGFSRDLATRKVGNRWVLFKKTYKQEPITGKMVFPGEFPYRDYQKFAKFCDAEYLQLLYTPMDQEYKRDVILTKLDKTEINKNGYLECPIEFTPLTLWYIPLVYSVNPTTSEFKGWTWDGTNGAMTWGTYWGSDETGSVTIKSDSDELSPCRITINGPITNPQWYHFVNGEKVADGKVNVSVASGNKLVIDTIDYPASIKVLNANGEEIMDAYQSADFSTDRFIELRHGTNKIVVSGNESTIAGYKVEGAILYGTV